MKTSYIVRISVFLFVALVVMILYSIDLPSLIDPSTVIATMGIMSVVTNKPADLIIAVTNLYRSPLSLSFSVDSGFLILLGSEPQPTVLPDSAST